MRFFRIGLGASIGMALVVACGSSSSNGGGNDAGDDGSLGDDGAVSIPCGAGPGGGALCASGMECCMPMFNLAGAGGGGGGGAFGLPMLPMNSCVPTGKCTGTVIGCNDGTNCSGGQVCCAGTPTPEGGSEAGAGGIGALLMGGAGLFGTTCQASCMPGQRQQCASSSECTGGQTCQAPNFGGFGGEGGLGSLIGGLFGGGGAGGFMLPMSCMTAPAEGGTDSGVDSSTDSGASETGTQTDAEADSAETGSTPDTGALDTGSDVSSQAEAGE